MRGDVRGILGTFNGDRSDDWKMRDGTLATSAAAFGESCASAIPSALPLSHACPSYSRRCWRNLAGVGPSYLAYVSRVGRISSQNDTSFFTPADDAEALPAHYDCNDPPLDIFDPK